MTTPGRGGNQTRRGQRCQPAPATLKTHDHDPISLM
jgi:hypothetical protein